MGEARAISTVRLRLHFRCTAQCSLELMIAEPPNNSSHHRALVACFSLVGGKLETKRGRSKGSHAIKRRVDIRAHCFMCSMFGANPKSKAKLASWASDIRKDCALLRTVADSCYRPF